MPLTLTQRRHHEACIDIQTIDRHIITITEDRARHQRCGNCWRTRSDDMALDVLLLLRLRFMDRRDVAMREN